MISPRVRRLRLATDLVRLRRDHGFTAADLATATGIPRQRISRLENGHVAPTVEEIDRILHALDSDADTREQLMAVAADGRQRGWWERRPERIGVRQALYADLEAGAAHIREYQLVFLPGLVQTPTYTQARAHADRAAAGPFDADSAIDARGIRQHHLHRDGGPRYHVVIDELAIRRPAVAADVLCSQLDHMAQTAYDQPRVSIQVLLLDAVIRDRAVPRSAFSVYQYPDPRDPIVVAVDTVTDDLVLTRTEDTGRYLDLHHALQDAALSPADSLDYLTRIAEHHR